MLELIQGRIFGTPLLMDDRKLAAIVEGLSPRFSGEVSAFAGAAPAARSGRAYAISGRGIATIGVVGVLVHRAGQVDPLSMPLRSYSAIERDLQAAMADKEVRGVVLDVDSPGGEVAAFELADAIFRMRGRKPIIAVANGTALSAGYAVAAAADAVFVMPSGTVGGIGVVAVHRDQSGNDAKEGLAFEYIHAGDRKVDGHPHAPLSDRARTDITQEITVLYDRFVDQVARHRAIPAAAVRATEAARYLGQFAVKAGLATHVGVLGDALAEADRRASARTTRPTASATPPRAALPPAAPPQASAPASMPPAAPRPPLPPTAARPPAVDPADPHGWNASIRRVCGSLRPR